MFDITTVREIDYGPNSVVYVYQDHDNPKLWYMVPVPRLVHVVGCVRSHGLVDECCGERRAARRVDRARENLS